MQINIDKILKPWYFTGFSVLLTILVFIMFISIRSNYRDDLKDIRSEDKYFRGRIAEYVVIPEREKLLKYTDYYYKLIGWYGEKVQSGRGMNKYQKTDFVLYAYNYEKWIGLPHFYFISKAKIESSFNPKATGALGEVGLFQHMPTADVIGTAYMELNNLRINQPWLARKLEFIFNSEQDLTDPINALKVEALLSSYYKRKFNNELIYWVSAVHWGEGRIAKLYRDKLMPIYKHFNFTSRETAEKYSRSPLMYYYVWAEHYHAFMNFRKDVNVDKGWIDIYKSECSKQEKLFIEGYKFFQKGMNYHDQIKKEMEDVKKLELKYYDLIKKGDKEYKKLLKLMKQGKFKNIAKEIFIPGRIFFNQILDEISRESKENNRRFIAFIQLFIIIIIGFLTGFGVYCIIKKILKRI